MSLGTADKIFLGVTLVDFAGIFVCYGFGLRLAYTKMDLMLAHLSNCPAIKIRAFLINTGPWGRMHVLAVITGLMVTPKIFLRDGGASAEDLNNFPDDIKRKLTMLFWANGGLLLVMLGLFLVIKVGLV
ncbi:MULTISPECIES: hypothetical protein [unclassified Pseudomonas]|uniref:hypothetical protein n=1 Tax=unclassified Pseudomonas TaxID=196821 RepID=UPI002AC9EC17|nr:MULTISPECIES: hypothetical protein [unclassified Pseudomonas]MEB0043728.1 hypothetical protein [Pseudomonas sp. MH10]MEB0076335.1 hypothetical protein [Pseudomonas sp. MH10out]MEB0092772.1 hypothetical protein [Pseudomonas sp. CCI4.2]MEB0101026.1 hypothetical protein [Pseudomonas sp. CCI3.2]MEB0119464.1 hypothetical protein [Pseudomonas sp. CCI1.2]